MKQENTASSPSGRHFGHYRSLLECFRQNNLMLPSLIVNIAHLSLVTAHPLQSWQTASQVMLEKGKGRFIEHLRIIQLCEAALNFVLHTILGHRLIRHVKKHSALSSSQYALPGQTCNNAVLNKVLFCDLSRQTLTPGALTDFDATAAFDRVIAGLSITTCQRVGLPRIAGYFMFHLLCQMKFHLITGFGKSAISFLNNEDDITGQGVLQGSGSATPIFIPNSLKCLSQPTTDTVPARRSFSPIQGSVVSDHSRCSTWMSIRLNFLNTTSTYLLVNRPAPTIDMVPP
jgi:hypothetical protein